MREVTEETVEHEVEIIWDLPPTEIEYVRERFEKAGTRQRSVPFGGDRLKRVGYAVLDQDAPNAGPGKFWRRVFFLKPGDRYFTPEGAYEKGVPMEGVDPLTVEPGKPGERTPRARGET